MNSTDGNTFQKLPKGMLETKESKCPSCGSTNICVHELTGIIINFGVITGNTARCEDCHTKFIFRATLSASGIESLFRDDPTLAKP